MGLFNTLKIMACVTLTSGRKLPCKGKAAGFAAVGFVPFERGIFTVENGAVTEIPTSITKIFQYEVKHSGNTYSEDLTSDKDARTTSFNGTLTINLQGLDLATRNQVKELITGELFVFVEMNNGDILLLGHEFGASLDGGNGSTGGSMADFSGWTLTFNTEEQEPFVFLDSAAKTKYITLATTESAS